jgi:hypothetical protein
VDTARHGGRLTAHAPVVRRSIRVVGGPVSLLLCACVSGVTVDRATATGPTLVLDVTNASSDQRSVGYEFDGDGTSGAGEGLLSACERQVQPYGEVLGSYSIEIDGTSVLDGTVPPNAAGAYLVVRVQISADGSRTAAAPLVLRDMPEAETRAIPGC